jgi:inner membrane protein
MPSIFTHAAVPLALWAAADRKRISSRLACAGIIASILPDADVVSFALHSPYADAFGHRGAIHSLLFAAMVAVCIGLLHRVLHARWEQALAWGFICAASHPLLDAMTSGGLGVALLWPWNETRWFAPWRPILVSPISAGFFSTRGMETLLSELRWVWLPLFVGAGFWKLVNRK